MHLDILEKLINETISKDEIYLHYNFLINVIRNNINRRILIDYILDRYTNTHLLFCFNLIYELDEFEDEIMYFLEEKNCKMVLTSEMLSNFLHNTSFGKKYLIDNIKYILDNSSSNIDTILNYAFSCNDLYIINSLANHPDLHIRYIFMDCLIKNYSDKLDSNYTYIINYLKEPINESNEFKMMDISDISKLAITAFKCGNEKLYKKLKNYILLNYKYNDLGEIFISNIDIKNVSVENSNTILSEFLNDIDNLFLTSSRYKFEIYNSYSKCISKEILDNFEYYLNIFKINGEFDSKLNRIFKYRLWDELTEDVDKYLSLSKDTTYNYVTSGSITSVYRIGDFTYKLCRGKYSKNKVICPNLYLIIKNLEEHYIRDEKTNKVLAGIDVQRYLTKDAKKVPYSIFRLYDKEMKDLGYYVADKLMYGRYGDNLMLLDSYKDADCSNPEELPDWFKEYPVVLVDRDLVYRLEEKKKLKKYWYSNF